MAISETEIIVRVLVAAGLGLLVGVERELRNHDAGLRTHMILVIGAALAGTVSVNLATAFRPDAPNGDPARLAAQVISGIGFLGAGVIFRSGTSVHGLTTAVSLWTMAIVGLAVGVGYYWASAAITALLLVVLTILDVIEDRFITSASRIHLWVWAQDRPGILDDVKAALSIERRNFGGLTIERDFQNGQVMIEAHLRAWTKQRTDELADSLSAINGIHKVKVNV